MNKNVKCFINNGLNKLTKEKSNQLYQGNFQVGDWIILGFDADNYGSGFQWAVKIDKEVNEFTHIHNGGFIISLDEEDFGCFRIKEKGYWYSNAQDWFKKPTIKEVIFFEKIYYANKHKLDKKKLAV